MMLDMCESTAIYSLVVFKEYFIGSGNPGMCFFLHTLRQVGLDLRIFWSENFATSGLGKL
jgi:hypothetical protein